MAGRKNFRHSGSCGVCDAVRDNLVLPEDVEFWVRVVNDEAPAVIDNSALTVIKETGGEFYETAMRRMGWIMSACRRSDRPTREAVISSPAGRSLWTHRWPDNGGYIWLA